MAVRSHKQQTLCLEQAGAFDRVSAPMVMASELPWRLLLRCFGVTLCYTPMIDAQEYVQCEASARHTLLQTSTKDRPLVVQFAANDAKTLVTAAKLVEGVCDAVDINLGCPQRCARVGRYGAFLLDDAECVRAMVEACARELAVPVFCKIRILPTFEETLSFALMLQKAGCSMLVVHGRRREWLHHEGAANWDWIKRIKEALDIPVVANGNVQSFEDAVECADYTGCNGVMSATGLLQDPMLFSPTWTLTRVGGVHADGDSEGGVTADIVRVTTTTESRELATILASVVMGGLGNWALVASWVKGYEIIRRHLQKWLRQDTEAHVDLWKMLNDPRIQRVGQFRMVVLYLAQRVGKDLAEAGKRLASAFPRMEVLSSLGSLLQAPLASLRLPTFRELKRSSCDEDLWQVDDAEEEELCFDLDL